MHCFCLILEFTVCVSDPVVLRFQRPSHWGCAISRWWTSRDRTPVTIRGTHGAMVRATGVSISVSCYCQVPLRGESYAGRHPGSRPEAKTLGPRYNTLREEFHVDHCL